jgi:large subunit ribosomal protein L6
MSRIGRNPVVIPQGVTVTRSDDGTIVVKGPKGELSYAPSDLVKIEITDSEIVITRDGEEREKRAHHGLVRSLLQNMVTGVTKGYVKRLEINGVGYRAQVQGTKLVLNLGFSHPVEHPIPEGITIKMDEEKKNIIVIEGIDKQKVGQVASEIRGYRPPEPYKGKGIKYEDEYIKRKAGKTAGKGD